MKKIGKIFAILVMVSFGLIGCSSGGNAPSEKQIKEDLQQCLQGETIEYNITKCTVDQSMTEENSYNASLTLEAEGKYSDYILSANVNYTKYDQGWSMDYWDSEQQSYQLVRYPTENDMDELLDNRVGQVSKALQYPTYNTLSTGNETVTYEGTVNYEVNNYATLTGDVTSTWVYNSYQDTFEFDNDSSNLKPQFSISLDGVYDSAEGRGNTLTINNCTGENFYFEGSKSMGRINISSGDSFNMVFKRYNDETRETRNPDIMYFTGDSGNYEVFDYEDANDSNVTASLIFLHEEGEQVELIVGTASPNLRYDYTFINLN